MSTVPKDRVARPPSRRPRWPRPGGSGTRILAAAPLDAMPGWFQPMAGYQPFTPAIETLRGLLLGSEIGHNGWLAVVWCLGLTVLGYFWSPLLSTVTRSGERRTGRQLVGRRSQPQGASRRGRVVRFHGLDRLRAPPPTRRRQGSALTLLVVGAVRTEALAVRVTACVASPLDAAAQVARPAPYFFGGAGDLWAPRGRCAGLLDQIGRGHPSRQAGGGHLARPGFLEVFGLPPLLVGHGAPMGLRTLPPPLVGLVCGVRNSSGECTQNKRSLLH